MIKTLSNKLENYCDFLIKPTQSFIAYDTINIFEQFHEKNDYDVNLLFVDKSKLKSL